jgi:hypothetical protein
MGRACSFSRCCAVGLWLMDQFCGCLQVYEATNAVRISRSLLRRTLLRLLTNQATPPAIDVLAAHALSGMVKFSLVNVCDRLRRKSTSSSGNPRSLAESAGICTDWQHGLLLMCYLLGCLGSRLCSNFAVQPGTDTHSLAAPLAAVWLCQTDAPEKAAGWALSACLLLRRRT